jgi:fructose-1,6-bisphosphatase/inositol monophosphatase family enzyme
MRAAIALRGYNPLASPAAFRDTGEVIPDVHQVIAVIRDVAAAEIVPRFRRLAKGEVSEKRPGEVVTVVDTAAEACLARRLAALAPESRVVGEEAFEHDPTVVAALGGPHPVWVIDPLDGTQNFVDGKACFATIVAYCVGGETLAGWIHDPLADQTVWAVAGQGTWCGSERLRIKAPAAVADMVGTLGKRLRAALEARRQAGDKAVPATRARYGCVGHEYLDLARGKLHFLRYTGKLKPWDHAAGILIHREAGGFEAKTDDRVPYRPGLGIQQATVLLAPDQASWDSLHALLAS